jgi:N-methylhydantoinase B
MFKTLSPVMPDRLVACSGGDLGALLRYGWHKDTGKWWSEGSIEGCGQGASHFSDGGNALIQIAEACSRNLPCEVEETRAPVIIERYELQQDSGGPGQFRGGLGVRRDWRLTGTGNLIATVERGIAIHSGVEGGSPGRRNYSVVKSSNPIFQKYSFGTDDDGLVILKTPSTPLFPGDYVSIRQGGGGGWGDPKSRSIERVATDVRSGYVSVEAARTEYGVVVDPKTLEVDNDATMALRGKK